MYSSRCSYTHWTRNIRRNKFAPSQREAVPCALSLTTCQTTHVKSRKFVQPVPASVDPEWFSRCSTSLVALGILLSNNACKITQVYATSTSLGVCKTQPVSAEACFVDPELDSHFSLKWGIVSSLSLSSFSRCSTRRNNHMPHLSVRVWLWRVVGSTFLSDFWCVPSNLKQLAKQDCCIANTDASQFDWVHFGMQKETASSPPLSRCSFHSCIQTWCEETIRETPSHLRWQNKPPPPGFHAWPGFRRNKPLPTSVGSAFCIHAQLYNDKPHTVGPWTTTLTKRHGFVKYQPFWTGWISGVHAKNALAL